MAEHEHLEESERARLAPFVSDLDAPVFALMNLPETTRGALFARYSRHPGTLRRLMLDEFGDELRAGTDRREAAEGERSTRLYERMLLDYGDDSVAQLGGAHIACEWVSNLLTKLLQRPRLGAYLEQSTRYIAYDRPMPDGRYRYYRHERLGGGYERAMDALFDTYSELLPAVRALLAERFPRGQLPAAAHDRAVAAKALDLVRGLLPASSLSHVGVFASGQTFERLIMHLRAEELPEAQACAEGMLTAMRIAMPSFVARVEEPDRGGLWVAYLSARARTQRRIADRLEPAAQPSEEPAAVRLLSAQGSEQELLAALLFEGAATPEHDTMRALGELSVEERAQLIAQLVGLRENRRHLPGRGFEALRYRFEVVSDYGAFRDLQRHRMLTVQWQALTPHLGAELPEELAATEVSDPYRAALERSREAWQELVARGEPLHAPYALCMAYRIRYILDLNAREAIHLIELRSSREGHSAYRVIAQQMHARIAEVHPAVAAAMTHLDPSPGPRLERILAESRRQRRVGSRI